MATFTNQATLTYNGGTASSNITTGELLEVLTATKTAVVPTYRSGRPITYLITLVNAGTADLTGLTVADDLGGYTFNGATVYPLSYTAGSYVCNYLMYTLLYLIDKKYPNIRGGFIHVPYAMEQVVNKPLGTPSMDLHQIARGLEKAVEAVVKNDADLAVDMGTTH